MDEPKLCERFLFQSNLNLCEVEIFSLWGFFPCKRNIGPQIAVINYASNMQTENDLQHITFILKQRQKTMACQWEMKFLGQLIIRPFMPITVK